MRHDARPHMTRGSTVGKNVLIVSSSLRPSSNSHILALAFAEGAREAGHDVETVSLRGKRIGFCRGCLACQAGAACPLDDDAPAIVERIVAADTIALATPIYFFEMAGQLKTLLDRSNPAYPASPAFRDVYLLATAADEDEHAFDGAVKGVQGWVDCFEQARLVGVVTAAGVDAPGAVESRLHVVNRARLMGCGV